MSRPADPFKTANARQLQCPVCKTWIACQRGRMKLDGHIERDHPEAWALQRAVHARMTGETL